MSPKVSARLLAVLPDRRLLELIELGHGRAFEVLVRRYREELLRYCARIGLSDSRAEDALQHAFLQAWLALERGTEVRELRPWLYRIVHNSAVNVMRGSSHELRPITDADAIASANALELDFERGASLREALSDVAALPPMQREAILLSAVDGRSHAEVASAMGISDGAVRGLIYRARATLRGAAAALTPQPLLDWISGGAARVTPTAGRLAELSTQGGGANGGALLRRAAVALTAAALVAGAAVSPLHNRSAHRGRAPLGTPDTASADAPVRSPPRETPTPVALRSVSAPSAPAHTSAPAHPSIPTVSAGTGTPHRHLAPRRAIVAPVNAGGPVGPASPGGGKTSASVPAATVASAPAGALPAGGGEGAAPPAAPPGSPSSPGGGGSGGPPPETSAPGSDDGAEGSEGGDGVDGSESSSDDPSSGDGSGAEAKGEGRESAPSETSSPGEKPPAGDAASPGAVS